MFTLVTYFRKYSVKLYPWCKKDTSLAVIVEDEGQLLRTNDARTLFENYHKQQRFIRFV